MATPKKHKSWTLSVGYGIMEYFGVIPIVIEYMEGVLLTDLLIGLNSGLSAMGFVLFMSGFLCYYQLINLKVVGIYSLASLIIPVINQLSNSDNRWLYSLLALQYMVIIILIALGVLYRKTIKVQAKNSMKYYYAIVCNFIAALALILYYTVQGETYGLYNSTYEGLILVNYLLGISLTILLLVFMIQLEHDHSTYILVKLKDRYSHDLGNNLQKIYSAIGIIEKSNNLESVNKATKILKAECANSANLITEIRNLE